MDSGIDGLVAWVTGASGGIGWAIAQALAEEGAQLGLSAHHQRERLAERVGRQPWAERATVLGGDLSDPGEAEQQAAAIVARHGRIDVTVVNAGIWPPESRPLWELEPARVEEVVRVDLLSAIYTARAALRALARTGPRADERGACLVFIGSTAGRFGEAGHADYAASKAALRGLVATLKNEIVALDPRGRVNLVEPGWTVTPMARSALADDAVLARVCATMPLRQLARPVDVARAVAVLAAPRLSAHVSGEILAVAGGMEGRLLWPEPPADGARIRALAELDEP